MNDTLDILLVTIAVAASIVYAGYALGPKKLKSAYSRWATKHFGLRAARWFAPGKHDSCSNCPSADEHKPLPPDSRR